MKRSLSPFKNFFIIYSVKLIGVIFGKKINDQKIFLQDHSNVLIIQLGSTQEALNITPFIKILKDNFNSTFSILVEEMNKEVFKNNRSVDNVFLLQSDIKYSLNLIWKLRKVKFDLIIDTSEKFIAKNSFYLALLRSKYKLGFAKDNLKLLTHKIEKVDPVKFHIVDRILNLTDALDMDYSKSDLNIFYEPSARSEKAMEDYFIKHDLSFKFTTVINISSELDIGFWGIDNFKSLIKYLRNYDTNIVIAASINDIQKAEKIADKKHLIYYLTDFDQYAQLLRSSGFIFSPDSFTVQLAAAFKIPIFCLFVQVESEGMINVPYNSDFDFSLSEKGSLAEISFGKVLNSFVPYYEYVYQRYNQS